MTSGIPILSATTTSTTERYAEMDGVPIPLNASTVIVTTCVFAAVAILAVVAAFLSKRHDARARHRPAWTATDDEYDYRRN